MFSQLGIVEQRRLGRIDQRQSVGPVMAAPVQDEVRPAPHLGLARLGVGLEREEGWEVVDFGENEAGLGCRSFFVGEGFVRGNTCVVVRDGGGAGRRSADGCCASWSEDAAGRCRRREE